MVRGRRVHPTTQAARFPQQSMHPGQCLRIPEQRSIGCGIAADDHRVGPRARRLESLELLGGIALLAVKPEIGAEAATRNPQVGRSLLAPPRTGVLRPRHCYRTGRFRHPLRHSPIYVPPETYSEGRAPDRPSSARAVPAPSAPPTILHTKIVRSIGASGRPTGGQSCIGRHTTVPTTV